MVYMIIFMKTKQIFWSQPPIMRMILLETDLFLAMRIVFKVFLLSDNFMITSNFKVKTLCDS